MTWEQFLIVCGRVPGSAFGLMPIGWTLRVEMIFSILMPAFVTALMTQRVLFYGAIAALLYLPMSMGWPFFVTNFACGILMRRHHEELRGLAQRWRRWFWMTLPVGVLLVQLGPMLGWTEKAVLSYRRSVSMMLGSALVVVAIAYAPAYSLVFSHKIAQFLGRISYSLYLIHVPVIVIFTSRLGASSRAVELIAVTVLVVGLAIAIATVMERAVEVPSQRLGRYLGRRVDTLFRVGAGTKDPGC